MTAKRQIIVPHSPSDRSTEDLPDYFLAHFNVVRPVGEFSVETPECQYFVEQLGKMRPVPGQDPGMLWYRHGVRGPGGKTMEFHNLLGLRSSGTDNPHLYTLAGWLDEQSLFTFARRRPDHVEAMKKLRHWVDRSEGATMVMWWAPRNERISGDMAWYRLEHLREHGPTQHAFNLHTRFPKPGSYKIRAA